MKNTIEFFCSNELVDYKKSIKLMEQRVKKINDNTESELLWFLEHPSVYTAGTSSKEKDLLNKNLLPVFKTNRGGEYTYHGPGQRVAYVMLDVRRRNYNVKCIHFSSLMTNLLKTNGLHVGQPGQSCTTASQHDEK